MSIFSSIKLPLLKDRNIFLYYLYILIFCTWPIQAIMGLYLLNKGFTFSDIGWTVFVFSISSLLSEIPTGYFADKFGRKTSILVGLFILCVISPLWTQGYLLVHYLVMSAIWMLALAFLSGSFEAYLYDYLKRKKLLDNYDAVISKSTMLMFIATAIGMIIGVSAYMFNPNLPYFILAGTTLISFGIVLIMENDSVHLAKSSLTTELKMFSGLKFIIKSPSLIWITAFVSLFFAYYHFFIEGMNLPYLVSLNTLSFPQIGLFLAVISLIQALFAARFDFLRKKLTDNQLIIFLITWQFFSLFFLSMAFGIAGFFFYTLFTFLEPLEPLVINSFSQKHIESSIRATTISSIKFVSSLVTALVGVIAGIQTDQLGIRTSFLFIAVISTLIFTVLFIVKYKGKINI